jgi:hypothetical protein
MVSDGFCPGVVKDVPFMQLAIVGIYLYTIDESWPERYSQSRDFEPPISAQPISVQYLALATKLDWSFRTVMKYLPFI